MQCTPSDPSKESSYGYAKEHCDYQPKQECITVSENIIINIILIAIVHIIVINYNIAKLLGNLLFVIG